MGPQHPLQARNKPAAEERGGQIRYYILSGRGNDWGADPCGARWGVTRRRMPSLDSSVRIGRTNDPKELLLITTMWRGYKWFNAAIYGLQLADCRRLAASYPYCVIRLLYLPICPWSCIRSRHIFDGVQSSALTFI